MLCAETARRTASSDAGKECFAYHLRGSQVVPVEDVRRIDARLRLWVAYDDGRWQVINYDYNVT